MGWRVEEEKIMHRILTGGLLSTALAFGLASTANTKPVVLKTDGVYHVRVCPNTVGLYAHCHAHVVTDAAGHTLVSSQPPVAGLGADKLRDAYKISTGGASSTIIS